MLAGSQIDYHSDDAMHDCHCTRDVNNKKYSITTGSNSGDLRRRFLRPGSHRVASSGLAALFIRAWLSLFFLWGWESGQAMQMGMLTGACGWVMWGM